MSNESNNTPAGGPAFYTAQEFSATNDLDSKPVWDVSDVMGYFNVSRVTVYRWVERGLLRSLPAIRHKRFLKKEVERFCREQGMRQ
jgi:hypothetical protein